VIIAGGGYDGCEDQDSIAPTCINPKGAIVYVLDASTGAVIRSFPTLRSVVGDVALAGLHSDGMADYAYLADTGGNIYRLDFYDTPTGSPQAPAQWALNRVAYMDPALGSPGRKFEFSPALQLSGTSVYLALGSGDREHPLSTSYPYTRPVVNRFYVYLDDLTTRTRLTNLDNTANGMLDTSAASPACGSGQVLKGSGSRGWFLTLNQNGVGEQVVTAAAMTAGMVTFGTNRPTPSTTSCTANLGEARGYFLNLLNGSGVIGVPGSCGGARSAAFVEGGFPPTPVVGHVSVDGVQKTVPIGAVQRSGASSSPIAPQEIAPPVSSKRTRVYWYTPGTDH
jgi:Tfp pilus tip-associated adhesin PilY1